MENSMENPQKTKNRVAIWSGNSWGIYLNKTTIQKDTRTPMFIAALFTITEIRKQSNCPSTDEQIMKMNIYIHIYTMEYYSAMKRNAFESVLMRWMNSEPVIQSEGFPGGSVGKKPACQCRRHKRCHFDPWCRKMPWKRAWQPTAVFLPGESQGERSLVGYGSWGCKESDMIKVT